MDEFKEASLLAQLRKRSKTEERFYITVAYTAKGSDDIFWEIHFNGRCLYQVIDTPEPPQPSDIPRCFPNTDYGIDVSDASILFAYADREIENYLVRQGDVMDTDTDPYIGLCLMLKFKKGELKAWIEGKYEALKHVDETLYG